MSRPTSSTPTGPNPVEDPRDLVATLEQEQHRLAVARFDNQDAWTLGNILVDLAVERGAAVTIDVRQPNQILFHHARPGTTPDNDRWVERKSRTVFHYLESSWLVRHRFLARGENFEQDSGLDPALFAAHGGSYPICVVGAGVVAAVTVSGLPQHEDHRLVVAGLGTFAASLDR
jgi:uncharacterized protein (UPF0303 family)